MKKNYTTVKKKINLATSHLRNPKQKLKQTNKQKTPRNRTLHLLQNHSKKCHILFMEAYVSFVSFLS